MLLDLHEVDGVAEAGCLEQIARIGPQRREVRQPVPVALEVPVVDGIEPDERGEQAHIGLGDGLAHEIALRPDAFLEPVEAGEEPIEGLVVGLLRTGETAPVHAVVDVLVDELRHLVDLVPQLLRIQIRAPSRWNCVHSVEKSRVICG